MSEALYDVIEDTEVSVEDAKSDAPAEAIEEIAESEVSEHDTAEQTDYASLIAEDVATLKAEFPELRGINDITDLNNPLRYAALRDLGLTPEEAYLATAKRRTQDTRAHLSSAHGRSAATPYGIMSQQELATARDLFPGMSDSELQRLYKRVTK